MEPLDLLGPAERHVAQETRSAIEEAQKLVRELADALDEINTDGIEAALLDSDRKESVIQFVDIAQKMGSSLAMYRLVPIIVGAVLKEKVEA